MRGGAVNMAALTNTLSTVAGRTVIDKTGFTRTFDVVLDFTSQQAFGKPNAADPSTTRFCRFLMPTEKREGCDAFSAELMYPILSQAVQDQMGLKLVAKKSPLEVLVIERAERPRY